MPTPSYAYGYVMPVIFKHILLIEYDFNFCVDVANICVVILCSSVASSILCAHLCLYV